MKMRTLATFVKWLITPNREPDFLIGSTPEDPYMRRWWVIPRNNWFNIYLHHMRHDDDDRAPHDHPWWSLSLCLDGDITEHQLIDNFNYDTTAMLAEDDRWWRVHHISKGQWKWRNNKYTHRLELPNGDAWTMFITGPKVRTWGFHCPKGFVKWFDFVDKYNPGNPGRGCGEME